MKTLSGHTGSVNSLKMITSSLLASAGSDYVVKLWNVTNGACLRNLTLHTNIVYALEILSSLFFDSSKSSLNLIFSFLRLLKVSDGSVGLASGGADSRIGIWSPVNYTLLKQISTHSVLCLKWLGPGTGYLASGGADFVINIYETKAFTFVRRLVGHTGMVYSLDVMTNGNLFSGSDDNSVWIWNLNTGQKGVGYNPLSVAITGVKVISSGIIAVVGNKKTMMFIDATTSTGTSLIVASGSAILAGTLLFNNDQVFVTAWSKTVTLINTNSYAFLLDIPTTYTTICLEYFPPGEFLDKFNRAEIVRE